MSLPAPKLLLALMLSLPVALPTAQAAGTTTAKHGKATRQAAKTGKSTASKTSTARKGSARAGKGARGRGKAQPVGVVPVTPTPVQFPAFDNATQVAKACSSGLAQAKRLLRQVEQLPLNGQWLAAYDRFSSAVDDAGNPIGFLAAVHPDAAVRGAAEACELRWNDFYSSLTQNQAIFKAVQALPEGDAIDANARKRLLEAYEDAGAALPPPQRLRAKQLLDRINALGQAFDRNIRNAAIRLPYTEAELAGVPDSVWKNAPRDEQGRVLLGVDYPTYDPVMQLARDPAARERMWRAKTNEGGEANLKLLGEIASLRQEYAALFGAPSWADFVLRRRMAQNPAAVQRFLGEVRDAVGARERQELEELRRAKAEALGQPLEAVRLERWDLVYYTERVRQARYAVDQEAFRPYFPPQESLAFALRVIEQMMGVRYTRLQTPAPEARAWHPDVQVYAVADAASGQRLGLLYVDLYPREGKYNHAAVWPVRGSATSQHRNSLAALVVNFNRQGLSLDELETLLHELGHAVHGNLSTTRYAMQAGTSVPRDFVEAPSQMLEDWVYDRRVLDVFAQVCPSCQRVPDELLAKAVAARDYGKGVMSARQTLYASYDMALYSGGGQDPMALWAQMEGATPLGHVPGTMFPAGFGHIAGGYSAGYYGYLWSLVVATDLRTAFKADRLDPAVGRRYRETILSQGSQRAPADMVRDFLGRDFDTRAFYEELKR